MLLKKMRPLNQAIIAVEYDEKTKTSVLVADLESHKMRTKPLTGKYSAKSAKRIWDKQRNVFSEIGE